VGYEVDGCKDIGDLGIHLVSFWNSWAFHGKAKHIITFSMNITKKSNQQNFFTIDGLSWSFVIE
jgi:hypothetical protein